MDIADAQRDMRSAFVWGAPGVLISGLVWLAAGAAAFYGTFQASLLVFFFGGMLIHPASVFVSRAILRAPPARKENGLVALALQGTAFLFVGLLLAYVISWSEPKWFFPAMMTAIGARYFTFATLYGSPIFIILGGALAALGAAAILALPVPPHMAALAGGALELAFSLALLARAFNRKRAPS